MAVWHRRAGKDEIVLNAIAELSEREVGTYWHCFPEYKQARKAIWNGINAHTGQRRIFDAFPQASIKRMQDDDMFLELHSGSTFQLLGSDRYDATVGSGPRGVAYSEWALSNPSAWGYHSPMIRETKGWAAFITTPRGNNHAKDMWNMAQKNPRWFSQLLPVTVTNALGEEDLLEALQEYQALHGLDMGRAMFEQEYLCSWAGAMIGAYFGAEMNRAEREGRIYDFEIDRAHPVHTAWDLGKAANNPIWCFQVIKGQPVIVDFYQPESENVEDWVQWLNDRAYHGTDYLPHDVMVTEWGTDRTRKDVLERLGRKVQRVPKVSVADGLQAARETINSAVFRANERTLDGVEGLKNFRREWDDDRKVFRDTPVKDWAEHRASAFRYLGLSWRAVRPPQPRKEQPKELEYEVGPDGIVRGNMDVRDAVDAMIRRKRALDD